MIFALGQERFQYCHVRFKPRHASVQFGYYPPDLVKVLAHDSSSSP